MAPVKSLELSRLLEMLSKGARPQTVSTLSLHLHAFERLPGFVLALFF